MGFDEGSIILNSENETYYAGQVIYGKLVFEQDKVKTFRGIYVKIKGFCKVHWTTTHTRRENDRSHTYTENHDSYEEYFSTKTYLCGGENGEHNLQPGRHEMAFECPIPANCPSSFEGKYGHVRYQIKIVVDRAFKIDQEKIKDVRVIAPINFKADPYCQEPLQFDIEDTYCCCCMSSGSSETVAKLPAAGFAPGQLVPVELSCATRGTVGVDRIKLAIEKRVSFHATQHPGTKHETETIAEVKKGPVPAGAARTWALELQVPLLDAPNLGPCRFIDVDYEFKVTVSPEGCHSDSEDTRRIVLGCPAPHPPPPPLAPPTHQPLPQYLNTAYPPQNAPYPSSNPSYPPQASSYLAQSSPYPLPQNAPYPLQNSAYPPQNTSYPVQNAPYPAHNVPYPGQSAAYPPPEAPSPSSAPPPSAPPLALLPPADPQPPPLPLGFQVPYPMPTAGVGGARASSPFDPGFADPNLPK